ncbi:MAG: ATP-binding cassette domain-containing protein [Candidatus Geothermincolia bacterium]
MPDDVQNQIIVEGLTYTYEGAEQPALDGVDLRFERGAICALLGRNGSGKSTLARCLNGLFLPGSGRVLAAGLDTAQPGSALEVPRRVAMVFQNPDTQIVGATVEEEVAFGPENLGLPSEQIRARVDRAMARAGITDLAGRQPLRLSQGQKQLVAIAGAIAMEPDFLVSDESTSMLDYSARLRILELFEKLRDDGMGIIHVTHFLEEATLADQVVVLESGRLAAQGKPRETLGDPDRVRGLGLDPLAVTVVTYELEQLGHPVPEDVLTVKELVSWLYA